ncbi:MAG: radical SAM protein [Chloroflexota bacterium]
MITSRKLSGKNSRNDYSPGPAPRSKLSIADLSRPDAVVMPAGRSGTDFREKDDIIIHLTVTGRCYAGCEGCINSAITFNGDGESPLARPDLDTLPDRDVAIIRKLALRHPGRGLTIAFYGGEPFLAVEKMARIKKLLGNSSPVQEIRYMVYTSGELLAGNLGKYPELLRDMWLYSVSIDGDEEQHRRVRPGTDLRRIRDNLRELKRAYRGNVLMWSTLREGQSLMNCFEEFLRLHGERLADHFFWHWADLPQPYADFPTYAADYGRDLEEIVDVYVRHCRRGEVLPVSHLNELVLYLVTGRERGHTACGVELARNFDILGGRVCACADLPPEYGEIDPDDSEVSVQAILNSLTEYKSQLGCYQCGVHPYCGGRCPVQAIAGSGERTRQICRLMRLHVGLVQARLPEIIDGFTRHGLGPQDLYDRSAYITRYTDVVP